MSVCFAGAPVVFIAPFCSVYNYVITQLQCFSDY